MREEWEVFERELRALSARRQVGVRFLLSHFGLPHLARLARRREWAAWLRAARDLTRRFHLARGSVAFHYGLRPALPSPIRGPFRALRGALSNSEPRLHMISTAGATRAEASRREEEDRDLASSEREMHVLGLLQPSYQRTLEIADQSAAAFGIEPRYPFFDRRLIDFCVAVPEVQKLADGWPRLLFRQAMEGILPAEIQWRSDKGNLSPNFHRNVRAAVAAAAGRAPAATLDGYVDPRSLEMKRQRYCAAAAPMARSEDGHALYRSMVLERWLAVRGKRPAAAPEPSIRPLMPASVV
jgi:asparagine synthase (glutamine-hydrolysing)